MQQIAQFFKVSEEQFVRDWCAATRRSADEAKKVYQNIQLPRRATKGSAGYDFFAPESFISRWNLRRRNWQTGSVAIIENPLYAVINEPNSTLQRLIRKLNLLDVVDEQSSSGKLDLIIQICILHPPLWQRSIC